MSEASTSALNVLVAMSGGVDSSVAAALLRDEGHAVTGVTLKLWGGASDSGCCSVSDVEDARRVAAQLGIDHYVFNFADEFDAEVVRPYVDAYANGRTPNPCVACNATMKFGHLLDRADELGFDAVATGHHVRRIERPDGSIALQRAVDMNKDQSYVLAMLRQPELERVLFPIGHLTKAEVRERAAELDLRTATKAESMDVCFITKGGREQFLSTRGAMRPGTVVDVDGRQLATHDGVGGFTIGQRRGLAVAAGERRYVVDIDADAAVVTIGRKEDLLRSDIAVEHWSFADGAPPPIDEPLFVQTRAHMEPVSGQLTIGASGEIGVRVHVPVPRVAPGQVVALYRGDVLLGGGAAK